SGKWYRPGPIAEPRILGRRPSQGTHGVWSAALWAVAEKAALPIDVRELPQVGCDVARKGDDYTCFHVRWGPVSLHHESHHGWDTVRTATRLKELAEEWAGRATVVRPPTERPIRVADIACKVDDDGVGGGVTDLAGKMGVWVMPVGAGTRSFRDDKYPNKR